MVLWYNSITTYYLHCGSLWSYRFNKLSFAARVGYIHEPTEQWRDVTNLQVVTYLGMYVHMYLGAQSAI